jgi:hypothetical protein
VDSHRGNLASSFVNGFVNAGALRLIFFARSRDSGGCLFSVALLMLPTDTQRQALAPTS